MLENRMRKADIFIAGPSGEPTSQALFNSLRTRIKDLSKVKPRRLKVKAPHPKTSQDILKLLRDPKVFAVGSAQMEEDQHPWASLPTTTAYPGLHLRAWDHLSEGKVLDKSIGFLSGASDGLLDTKSKRAAAISNHANWGNRHKTPFISTTTVIDEIERHRVPPLVKRQERNGLKPLVKVTVINIHARCAEEMPVLKMSDELDYYRLQGSYGNHKEYGDDSFYRNEYLSLFCIPPSQIVRTWLWSDIEEWMESEKAGIRDWYAKVAVPAFEAHEQRRKEGDTSRHGLGCPCCGG